MPWFPNATGREMLLTSRTGIEMNAQLHVLRPPRLPPQMGPYEVQPVDLTHRGHTSPRWPGKRLRTRSIS